MLTQLSEIRLTIQYLRLKEFVKKKIPIFPMESDRKQQIHSFYSGQSEIWFKILYFEYVPVPTIIQVLSIKTTVFYIV